MIKKLKIRFVLVNMLILTFVLFATLSSIYIMMSKSEIKVSDEIMETLIENHRKTIPPNKKIPKDGKPADFEFENLRFSGINQIQPVKLGEINEPFSERFYQNTDGQSNPQWPDPWANPWANPWENPWANPWFNPWYNPWGNEEPDNDFEDDNDNTDNNDLSEPNHEDRPEDPQIVPPKNDRPEKPDHDKEPLVPPVTEQNIVTEQPSPENTQEQTSLPDSPMYSHEVHTDEIYEEPAFSEKQDGYVTSATEERVNSSETASESAVTKTPSEPDNKPPLESTTRYNGNLVRSHIIAEIGSEGEIHHLSMQYFFNYENDTVENEEEFSRKIREKIYQIISEGSTSGKCKIETVSCRYKISQTDRNGERIIIFLDRSIEISTLHRLMISFIFIGCAGLIVVFLLSLFLANWAIKPIEVAWNRQKQFIADASHELKTPLTVIATNTDVVLSNPNDSIKNQERWLHYIRSETSRMSKLVAELLYIAKSDSNEIRMEMYDFNISDAVSEVCLNFEAHAFEEQRELIADISPRLKYFGDEDRIKQLFTILVDNAIKYSIIGTQISVSLFRNNQGKIKFCISNKCENLTEENISKLFDRFYRVDPSRNSGTGGNGLGLNIAQAITEAHNGQINVTFHHGIISFTVTL